MFGLIAKETMWLAIHGNVLMSRQGSVTVVAAEMFQMPDLVLRAGVLHGKDELVTGGAARNVGLGGIVTGTVDVTGLVVIQQVDENFLILDFVKTLLMADRIKRNTKIEG